MGCTPSKSVTAVYPANNDTHQPQEELPAPAPSSSPHRSNRISSSSPELTLASELQQRLLSHISASSSNSDGGGSLTRQLSIETDRPPEPHTSYNNEPINRSHNQRHKGAINEQDGSNPLPSSRIQPSKPFRYPLQLQCGSDSQVEFFKMLEKKISEGPDYELDKSRLSGSSSNS